MQTSPNSPKTSSAYDYKYPLDEEILLKLTPLMTNLVSYCCSQMNAGKYVALSEELDWVERVVKSDQKELLTQVKLAKEILKIANDLLKKRGGTVVIDDYDERAILSSVLKERRILSRLLSVLPSPTYSNLSSVNNYQILLSAIKKVRSSKGRVLESSSLTVSEEEVNLKITIFKQALMLYGWEVSGESLVGLKRAALNYRANFLDEANISRAKIMAKMIIAIDEEIKFRQDNQIKSKEQRLIILPRLTTIFNHLSEFCVVKYKENKDELRKKLQDINDEFYEQNKCDQESRERTRDINPLSLLKPEFTQMRLAKAMVEDLDKSKEFPSQDSLKRKFLVSYNQVFEPRFTGRPIFSHRPNENLYQQLHDGRSLYQFVKKLHLADIPIEILGKKYEVIKNHDKTYEFFLETTNSKGENKKIRQYRIAENGSVSEFKKSKFWGENWYVAKLTTLLPKVNQFFADIDKKFLVSSSDHGNDHLAMVAAIKKDKKRVVDVVEPAPDAEFSPPVLVSASLPKPALLTVLGSHKPPTSVSLLPKAEAVNGNEAKIAKLEAELAAVRNKKAEAIKRYNKFAEANGIKEWQDISRATPLLTPSHQLQS